MKTILLALAFAGIFAAVASGELVLDGKVIEVKPKPEDETVSAIFTFTNKGTKTVKVLSVESKCTCVSASVDAASYAAGAKGIGTAEFKVGSFVGKHEKFIVVNTDDPAQPEFVVTFVLDVPEVIQVEPRTLQWWLGDAPDEKHTTVKVVGKDPMKIVNVSSTRDGVEFTWKEVKPGREYTVTVKPASTNSVFLGALKIETDSKIPKYQRQLAYFSVYRKPDSALGAAAAPAK
ncbi:MAG: DUF1573 domain-containing protein [Verrucomicrobiaceae bacterium]|nr:DUF1573 domain-containing protein [Verrucomicrobiaceae bacterium]